ncbi:Rha family transcriptional regulator [Peribacillus sp. TH14]|uniref:Rha family transcriptional regulator n=1 Tax=Peribacillus sp. TH14 TaxID=2798481 RepID=UPI0019140608|nr:Rha family transcriptional regulator [Peribacillus sp. TH14]MBK5497438.1 Rha family transcriptional regulator [Peribacillus sp. TH14]
MEIQIIQQNGQLLVDSREVAEMVGKKHAHLLRDIAVYKDVIDINQNPNLDSANFFIESYYMNDNNQKYSRFLLTRKGCHMVANKMTGEKGVLFTAAYVTKFEEMENKLKGPRVLTAKEQLKASMKLSLETSEEVGVLKEEVAEIKDILKNKMTIDHAKQSVIQSQINIRIGKLWGIEETKQNFSKRKLYSNLHSNLHRAFMVTSYKDVKDSEFDEVLSWVKTWRPLI